MSSSNLNMYAGAFLGTVFIMMTVGIVGEAIFHTETPEQEGFAIAVAEGEAPAVGGGAEAPAIEPIAQLLASADAGAGATVFKKCAACHTVDNGGANKVGPNLWDIVNRPVAGHEGFKYSAAMKTFAEGGTVWDYDHLNAFLKKPKDLVPGTAMGFAGLSKVEDRANVVAYLRSLSDSPASLPDANAAPAAGGEAAAPAATDTGATEAPAATQAPAATEGTAPAN